MRIFFLTFLLLYLNGVAAQSRSDVYFQQVVDAAYVQYPPIFTGGQDSAVRFYLSHFKALDSMSRYASNRGDSGVFIRVEFSFIIDENGVPYEPVFEKISSVSSDLTRLKTLTYFFSEKRYYQKAVKALLQKMPIWRPAVHNGRPVKCRIKAQFQVWNGQPK